MADVVKAIEAGEMPVRGQFTAGRVAINADLLFAVADGPFDIQVTDGNDQRRVDEATQELRHIIASGGDCKLTYTLPYDSRIERIAWLRVAYLLAFASLGYSFILDPCLKPIWKQIRNPKDQLIDVERLVIRVEPAGRDCILLVQGPEPFEGSAVVCVGNWMILLPRSAALLDSPPPRQPGGITLSGLPLALPRAPEHRLDFHRAA